MNEKRSNFAVIYAYLAYLHIQGRGGAIRSESQAERERECFNAADFALLAPAKEGWGHMTGRKANRRGSKWR